MGGIPQYQKHTAMLAVTVIAVAVLENHRISIDLPAHSRSSALAPDRRILHTFDFSVLNVLSPASVCRRSRDFHTQRIVSTPTKIAMPIFFTPLLKLVCRSSSLSGRNIHWQHRMLLAGAAHW